MAFSGARRVAQRVHEQRLESHWLVPVFLGLERVEKAGKAGVVPTSVTTCGVVHVEVLGGDGREEHDVVVEIDVSLAEAWDTPEEGFDGVAVEGGQVALVTAENNTMVDDGVGDVPVGKMALEVVVEVRRYLLVGDEIDVAYEGGETVDGGDAEIDFAHRGVARGACDVVVLVFAMCEVAVALGTPGRVLSVNPQDNSINGGVRMGVHTRLRKRSGISTTHFWRSMVGLFQA